MIFLLIVIPFILTQNCFGNSKVPSVNFQSIFGSFNNATSLSAFQIATCTMVADATYDLLLIKQIIGNAREVDNNNFLLSTVKNAPVVSLLIAQFLAMYEGLACTLIPASINYLVENLYSFFMEDAYWRESIISYVTHMTSSYLLTLYYFFYLTPDMPSTTLMHSLNAMLYIFMFQNYGAVAVFTYITLNNSLVILRKRYMNW